MESVAIIMAKLEKEVEKLENKETWTTADFERHAWLVTEIELKKRGW